MKREVNLLLIFMVIVMLLCANLLSADDKFHLRVPMGIDGTQDAYSIIADRVLGLDAGDVKKILGAMPDYVLGVMFYGSRTAVGFDEIDLTLQGRTLNRYNKYRATILEESDLDIGVRIQQSVWNTVSSSTIAADIRRFKSSIRGYRR